MSSKSTWAKCETISKQTKKVSVHVDLGAPVPTPQDTSEQDTFPNRMLPSMLLCIFCYFHYLWDGVKRSRLAEPGTGTVRASLMTPWLLSALGLF